jgi:hypothetical protein
LITRGSASFSATKDSLFDALQSSCKDIGANVAVVDRSTYSIDGKSGTMWLQNRFSFKFHARLVDDGERIKLEVYDFSPVAPDKRFIKKLLDKVAAKVPPVSTDYNFEVVEGAGGNPLVKVAPAAVLVPSILERGRLMVQAGLVKTFEYKIKVVSDAGNGNLAGADRMEILPVVLGNTVNLCRGKAPVMSLPVGLIDAAPVVQLDHGLVGEKKKNFLLDLHFSDGAAHSIRLDVEDKDGIDIVQRLASLKKRGDLQERSFEYEYFDGSGWMHGKMYPSLPILAEGESLIRTAIHTEGIFSKHVRWIKALTNIRVLFYDFETSESVVVPLPQVEDVLVMNKRTESVSDYSGQSTWYSSWEQSRGESAPPPSSSATSHL